MGDLWHPLWSYSTVDVKDSLEFATKDEVTHHDDLA